MRALYAVGISIVLLAVFHAGVTVGFHKAKFSFHMGEKYYRAFEEGGPRSGVGFAMGKRDFTDAHGAAGKIIGITYPIITVLGMDNIEKNIFIDMKTEVRKFRNMASTSDLVIGEHIIVIGEPNDDAEITARLIRIIPAPPMTQN